MTTVLSRGTPPVPAGPAPVRTRRHRRGPAPWLVVGGAVAGLVALTPLIYLAIRALEPGLAVFAEIVAQPRTAELMVRSVALAAAVTGACLLLGTVGAWLVVRTDLPGRRAWAV